MTTVALITIAVSLSVGAVQLAAQSTVLPKEEILFLTSKWEGERFDDGRPKLPSDLLERAQNIRVEEAWQILHELGYQHQYDINWKRIHDDVKVIGRALTAHYMPHRPDLEEKIRVRAREEGRDGRHLHWPINMLTEGDVYVADNAGREGSLMGESLGNIIYNNSGNGVIFDGFARDLPELRKIDGFNAFVRDFGPHYLHGVQLMRINGPVTIGRAIVLPGDLVLGDMTGVVFIPAHRAEQVIGTVEFVQTITRFGHEMVDRGLYGPREVDDDWSEEIKDAFQQWLEENPEEIQYTREEVEEFMDLRLY